MATTAVTVDEYLRTSFEDGDREYVDGEILERNLGENGHARLQTKLSSYLLVHYPQYWVAVEMRVQVRATRFRVPDITVLRTETWEPAIITEPPHVVVELLSPDDRAADIQKKIAEYLSFGVPYVWVIDPKTRAAWVWTSEGARTVTDGVLRAFDPDIEVPLAAL
ncbi:MAG TPA: Uma2 family endonuclease [Bryobacteraceae bacterium]|nr:Uma2 family endonuclease [Bryobacteraceae bacterium]